MQIIVPGGYSDGCLIGTIGDDPRCLKKPGSYLQLIGKIRYFNFTFHLFSTPLCSRSLVFACQYAQFMFPVFFSSLHHILPHISTGGIGVRTAGRGLSLCDVTNLSPAAYRNFSCGGSRPSDARCSTPVPNRKRRCTMVVDYKEPSLNV